MTQTTDPWQAAREIIGSQRLLLGPQASHQLINDPSHYCMVLSRYWAASALIGSATDIVELGCGEGLGSRILIQGRAVYYGVDNDADALAVAQEMYGADDVQFRVGDIAGHLTLSRGVWDAVIALDVIEHIPIEEETTFMDNVVSLLGADAVAVIGTPNAAAFHLASPQSKVGHCNNYTHDRLHALMSRYFRVVQSFGMNDVSLHLGHPEMRHYLMMCGIGPR